MEVQEQGFMSTGHQRMDMGVDSRFMLGMSIVGFFLFVPLTKIVVTPFLGGWTEGKAFECSIDHSTRWMLESTSLISCLERVSAPDTEETRGCDYPVFRSTHPALTSPLTGT